MVTIRYTLTTKETAPNWLYASNDAGTSTYYFKYHDGSATALIPSVISIAGSGLSPIFDTDIVNPSQLNDIFARWSSVLDVNFSTTSGEKHVYIGAVTPNTPGWLPSAATLTAHGVMDGQSLAGQPA